MLDMIFWVGSYLHLLAMITLLMKVLCTQDCTGISAKSQFLYAVVFTTRYLDLFTMFISKEHTVFKITSIVLTYCTLFSTILFFGRTYEKKYDTVRMEKFIISCFVLAVLVNHGSDYLEILWTFSIYLEAVAMVPQFHFIRKAKRIHKHIISYIAVMAVYEGLYLAHWGYEYYYTGEYDNLRLSAGAIQFILYCEFFLRILPWLCTPKADEQPTVATVDVHVVDGAPNSGHLASNVGTVVLTPASLTGFQNDKVNLLDAEETIQKY